MHIVKIQIVSKYNYFHDFTVDFLAPDDVSGDLSVQSVIYIFSYRFLQAYLCFLGII